MQRVLLFISLFISVGAFCSASNYRLCPGQAINDVAICNQLSIVDFLHSGNFHAAIFDVSGKIFCDGKVDERNQTVTLSHLPSGSYYYVVMSGNIRKSVVKFIKTD